jgi:hypothetical protein
LLGWKTGTSFLIPVGLSCCALAHLFFTWSNHVLIR